MKKLVSILMAALLIGLMIPITAMPAFAEDYIVCNNGSEIQALIDDADPGDKLYVKVNTSYSYYDISETVDIDKTLTIYFKTDDDYRLDFQCLTGSSFLVSADNVELHFEDKKIGIYGNNLNDNHFCGEGIYVDGDNCLIDGVKFVACGVGFVLEDFDDGDATTNKDGSAVYVDGANCTIQNCEFLGCRSKDGGFVYVNGEGCNIVDCTFDFCKAYGDGGAICVNKDDCHIENCTFKDCIADDDGGAIYVCYNTDGARIYDCTFENCSCKGDGQYVYGDGDDPDNENDTWVYNCSGHFGEEEYYYDCFCSSSGSGFTLSQGNIWIIIAGAVVILGGIVAIVISKKKKAE